MKTDFAKVKANLEQRGFAVTCFGTGREAAAYLNSQINGLTVGFGGSMTLQELGLYELLGEHNEVYWHWRPAAGLEAGEILRRAAAADVYLTSVNGLAETGEIINIDGTCNRVSASVFGHRQVYFVAGDNKLAASFEEALWRARNIAAPKNAQRLQRKTPCAVRADKCYDCKSPERICRNLSVLWEAPNSGDFEVVLIGEELGY